MQKDADDALDIYNGLVSSMKLFSRACASSFFVLAVANPTLCILFTIVGEFLRETWEKHIIVRGVASSVRLCLTVSMGGTPAFSSKIGR